LASAKCGRDANGPAQPYVESGAEGVRTPDPSQVKDDLARWLAPKGLAFNEDKTRIVELVDGFDFLGFNIRRYPNGKLLIKPSKAAVQRIRSRLAAEVKALHGANAEAVITTLNPVIRGWAAYYRTVVSKEIFNDLDHYMWVLTYRWARRAHEQGQTVGRDALLRCVPPQKSRPVGVR
jgi:Group II intron, maturase-specific domain